MVDTLGARIARFRGRSITQRELAEQAEISLSMVRAIEQSKKNPSVPTLQKIARALDVDVAELVGTRYGMPSSDPDAGVVAIRRALTPVDDLIGQPDDETPVSMFEAQRTVSYAWGAYWSGRYELLSSILPPGITQLRATAHAAQSDELAPAHEQLARMMWVTGCTLVHLGQPDPAYMAIREALIAAEKSDDELLLATLRGSVAWQLLVLGRYEESHAVALKAAASVEPHGNPSQQHLAVHGSLLLQGATAAGRGQRVPEALSLAGEAGEVADRLGGDTKWYECNFGPSQVVMQSVDINVSSERYPEALKAAKAMPNRATGLAQVSQARHLIDKATAAARSGQ
jgi:transcriptional regulator with XRE-family HTH domain